MAYNNILVSVHDQHIGIVMLNRPKQLNALNPELMTELGAALLAFDADEQIGCIIITGNEKAFAAGADIPTMAQFDFAQVYPQTRHRRSERFCFGRGLRVGHDV